MAGNTYTGTAFTGLTDVEPREPIISTPEAFADAMMMLAIQEDDVCDECNGGNKQSYLDGIAQRRETLVAMYPLFYQYWQKVYGVPAEDPLIRVGYSAEQLAQMSPADYDDELILAMGWVCTAAESEVGYLRAQQFLMDCQSSLPIKRVALGFLAELEAIYPELHQEAMMSRREQMVAIARAEGLNAPATPQTLPALPIVERSA